MQSRGDEQQTAPPSETSYKYGSQVIARAPPMV